MRFSSGPHECPNVTLSIPDRWARCGDGLGNPLQSRWVYFFFAVLFPPASRPDLNPIRKEVSKIKRWLRGAGAEPARTPSAIAAALQVVTPKRRHGLVCSCGLRLFGSPSHSADASQRGASLDGPTFGATNQCKEQQPRSLSPLLTLRLRPLLELWVASMPPVFVRPAAAMPIIL